MGVSLAKDSIDLGIVITDSEAALAFYVGVLGFEHVADTPMPIGGGGTMHRLLCGTSLIKLVNLNETPPAAAGGGIPGATGMRYFTMIVDNLAEITGKINRGEGTLGALVNERTLHDSAESVIAGVNDSKFARWLIRHYQKKGIKLETAEPAAGEP